MTAAQYIRVSTADQNADMQRRELAAFARRRGIEITETFLDVASGADRNRPELRKLLDRCQKGFIETVLVWKLDRFGRSLLDCLQNLEFLEREHVRFIAITDGIDLERGNATARLTLQILGAAAEFERALIRERSTAGLKRYREDYDAGDVGRTVHSRSGKDLPAHRPRRVFDLQKARELRAQGIAYPTIAERLGIGVATLYRRMRSAAP